MNQTGNQADDSQPSVEQVWQWLHEVPDPEIPVISVVDLGIVREVQWQDNTLLITVTPTYSGCPAARIINEDIINHLRKRGIGNVQTERRLSPAWTTAWLSEEGREKLRRYGIAPPIETVPVSALNKHGAAMLSFSGTRTGTGTGTVAGIGAGAGAGIGIGIPVLGKPAKEHPACPQCQSRATELISQFGSTPCKANYRCTACLEPFDYFKCL